MIAPAIGVLLVSFSQSLGVAQDYADKHGYEIDANQELNSFAVVNLGNRLVRRANCGRQYGAFGRERQRRWALSSS